MYPAEPFSAAAFMNSPSIWINVSGVSLRFDAGRATEGTITPASSATARTGRIVFMKPPFTGNILRRQEPFTTESQSQVLAQFEFLRELCGLSLRTLRLRALVLGRKV